jgi:hypothetical protein
VANLRSEIDYTVDTLVEEVTRWSPDQRDHEYLVRKLPVHLVLPQLAQRLGSAYVVVGKDSAIVVRRRGATVKHA